MGITIREFEVAMETYGAERLNDFSGSRYPVSVPCFYVAGITFYHSGSYYIVQMGKKVSKEIMDKAMAEFGEKHPGGDNFWWGETHSIRGILTLAAMLDGKYSKEFIGDMTNKTYKKLLDCPSIKTNAEFPFHSVHSPKMEKLYKLLAEYSNIVNPFGNSELKFKEPTEYLDTVDVSLAFKKDLYTRLNLSTNSCQTNFNNDKDGWHYNTAVSIQKNHKNGSIHMGHYYTNGNDNRPIDEVVHLSYYVKTNSYNSHPDDIDLRISLKTGLAWQTSKEEEAKLASDEQIEIMITHLQISIKKIKNRIIRNMITK